uniref:Uncharacterized protein n=1 Tax=Methylophaga nitratireducenticrescens TaxID=754476 RepID=I1XFG0_METNJ
MSDSRFINGRPIKQVCSMSAATIILAIAVVIRFIHYL